MGITLNPPSPHPPKSTGLVLKIVRVLEMVGILIGICAFVAEFGYHKFEERRARSWQLIVSNATAPKGMIEALEYLNRQRGPNWLTWLPFLKERVSLEGIELIPPILAESWKLTPKQERELKQDCPQFTFLREARLASAILIDATLACADLWGADIRAADLKWSDLRRALLVKVKGKKADLEFADLEGANLRLADLREANLPEADLKGANLRQADLRGADLEWADLRGAGLWEADLRGADLRGADLRQIRGVDCHDLRLAKSWEQAFRDDTLACGAPIPASSSVAE